MTLSEQYNLAVKKCFLRDIFSYRILVVIMRLWNN